MANVLGGADGGMSFDERLHHMFAAEPTAKVHLYGKSVRPGRKIGHVTVLGETFEDVRARAARAAAGSPTRRIRKNMAPAVGIVMGSDSDWPT